MPENVYRRLQQALNSHPVGFRASETGADIQLLKHIFTPEQAEIVSRLDWHFQSTETIYEKVSDIVSTQEELSLILHKILRRGGLMYRRREQEMWALAPLVVGMYEYQVDRLTPEMLVDAEEYWQSPKSDPPAPKRPGQMRVIPIGKSITQEHHVARFEDIAHMVDSAGESIALIECICRKTAAMEGHSCERTSRAESCMGFRDFAEQYIEQGTGRRISREEAYEALRKSQEEGLVLMPSNSQSAEFVCSCCPDCCGMLRGIKYADVPADIALNNYQACVDSDLCIACNECVEICPMDAVRIQDIVAVIDLKRCIGCGVCVVRCAPEAIRLERKTDTVTPPDTMDDLYTLYDSLRQAENKGN